MRFLVVEHFREGDPRPVYDRFRAQGRLAPDDVVYVDSWVTEDLRRCFQVMDSPNRGKLDEWIANWADLVEFEVYPVITSAEAQARVSAP